MPLAQEAFKRACEGAGMKPDQFDHVIISGLHGRAAKAAVKALGVDPHGYDEYAHPVQVRLRAVVGALLSTDLGAAPWGYDGCAIPTYAVPLRTAAVGAYRWANPTDPAIPEELRDALARVRAAAIAYPRLISGGGFLDTDLIRGGEGGVVAKQGAEGLCLVGAPGIGLALLARGGVMTIIAYTGHPGGLEEATAVEGLLRDLDPGEFQFTEPAPATHRFSPPRLFVVRRCIG